jgi:hypothetical protein
MVGSALGGISMETAAVAKKKGSPKPQPRRIRSATTNIRSSPEWKEWVDGLAEFDRAPSVNELFDRALVAYAREIKYPKPAPKR